MNSCETVADRLFTLGNDVIAWLRHGHVIHNDALRDVLNNDPDGMVRETVGLAREFLREHPHDLATKVDKDETTMRGVCGCGWEGPVRRSSRIVDLDLIGHDRAVLVDLRAMAVEGDPVRDAAPRGAEDPPTVVVRPYDLDAHVEADGDSPAPAVVSQDQVARVRGQVARCPKGNS